MGRRAVKSDYFPVATRDRTGMAPEGFLKSFCIFQGWGWGSAPWHKAPSPATVSAVSPQGWGGLECKSGEDVYQALLQGTSTPAQVPLCPSRHRSLWTSGDHRDQPQEASEARGGPSRARPWPRTPPRQHHGQLQRLPAGGGAGGPVSMGTMELPHPLGWQALPCSGPELMLRWGLALGSPAKSM